MTREEALKKIKAEIQMYDEESIDSVEWEECYEALKQQPCEDCISRKAVLEWIKGSLEQYADTYSNDMLNIWLLFEEQIKAMPPVTPEPKTGHWIFDYVSADGHRVYHCSECGCYLKPKHSEPLETFKYCSLCGAWMIESQESEE